jgi:hypothetical protein
MTASELESLAAASSAEEPFVQFDCCYTAARNVVSVEQMPENSPFRSDLPKYQADQSKAYLHVEFLRATPQLAGPVAGGNMNTYHPGAVSRSHGTFFHQQVNIDHKLVSHGASRDRICGTIVATAFPRMPGGGWSIPETAEQAPSVQAVLVVAKQAAGMRKILGEHLTGQSWGVSIECGASLDNMGIYHPEERQMWQLSEAPEEYLAAVSPRQGGGLNLGKVGGVQLAWALGHDKGSFYGSGIALTKTPADRSVRIHEVHASLAADYVKVEQSGEYDRIAFDVGRLIDDWVGKNVKILRPESDEVTFQSEGVIRDIFTEGRHPVPSMLGIKMEATEVMPLCLVQMVSGKRVLVPVQRVKKVG